MSLGPGIRIAVLMLISCSAHAQSIAEQQDALVIDNLRAAGSDLGKPHEIDFWLYFPSKSSATAAAAEMRSVGYLVLSVDQQPGRADWRLRAQRRMLPRLDSMVATTRTLEAIAQRNGGDYDGWETAVVR